MKIIFDSYKKNGTLHHAYLLVGEREAVSAELIAFIESGLGIPTRGNPDFWHGTHDSLSIEEGRGLKEMQDMRAISGGKKIFIIATNTITEPAQNSLLKVFEEPTPDTHFFLIMPSAETLLPTLRSRLLIVTHEGAGEETARTNAAAFVRATAPERLAIAKKLAEQVSDEKISRTDVLSMLSEMEKMLYEKAAGPKAGGKALSQEDAESLSELLKIQNYLSDRSASVKMLLEHLGLIMPILK